MAKLIAATTPIKAMIPANPAAIYNANPFLSKENKMLLIQNAVLVNYVGFFPDKVEPLQTMLNQTLIFNAELCVKDVFLDFQFKYD